MVTFTKKTHTRIGGAPHQAPITTSGGNYASGTPPDSYRAEGSPVDFLVDPQGTVAAVTSFVSLAGRLLRPPCATQRLKAAKADAA